MTTPIPGIRIRVAIVDDQKSIAQSLQQVLSYAASTEVVFIARSGGEFLEKIKSLKANALPDVVIMDVNMPGMNGIEAVRQGKALYPAMKFIMLTVFDDEETLFEAIQAGASGYLLKDERATVILSHIESMMESGSAPMSPKIARKTLDLLASSSKPVSGKQLVVLSGLSAREKDVLYLLVDGLEYKEISERLFISPHTVRKHIANIYEKLHISSKAQAIRLMQGTQPAPVITNVGKYKILLVDDHSIILDSLSMMVGTFPDMHVAGKINNPLDVIAFLQLNEIDLVITDLSMPQLSGLELAAKIKSHDPGIKVLILTVSESADPMQQARALGLDGYILKKTSKEELSKAIRLIMQGETYYSLI